MAIAQHGATLVTRTVKESEPILTITSELGRPAQADSLTPIFPSYRLKLIPRADGPGAAIKQLVTAAPQDVTTHLLYQGRGTVNFGATVAGDLRPFGPVEELDAFYQEASYTETYGTVVYDYLTEAA